MDLGWSATAAFEQNAPKEGFMKIGRLIGLSLLALSLIPSIATAVFADGGDTTLIHGCVAKDGTTRVVSPTTACKNNETPRHWPTEARIVADETRITNTENTNTTQDSSISAIQTKNTQQDADIAALQGQGGGGSGGLVVKDSLGQVVGKVASGAVNTSQVNVFRLLGNTPLGITVASAGVVINQFGVVNFGYTTNNCTGTRYLFSQTVNSFSEIFQSTDDQTLYYPAWPLQQQSIESFEQFLTGEDPSGVGACTTIAIGPSLVGTPSTISMQSLGTPLFHLE